MEDIEDHEEEDTKVNSPPEGNPEKSKEVVISNSLLFQNVDITSSMHLEEESKADYDPNHI